MRLLWIIPIVILCSGCGLTDWGREQQQYENRTPRPWQYQTNSEIYDHSSAFSPRPAALASRTR